MGSIIKEAALWVAYRAKDFFVDGPEVITSIAQDSFETAGRWTKNAATATAKLIVNGDFGAVPGAVADAAGDIVGFAGDVGGGVIGGISSGWGAWIEEHSNRTNHTTTLLQ